MAAVPPNSVKDGVLSRTHETVARSGVEASLSSSGEHLRPSSGAALNASKGERAVATPAAAASKHLAFGSDAYAPSTKLASATAVSKRVAPPIRVTLIRAAISSPTTVCDTAEGPPMMTACSTSSWASAAVMSAPSVSREVSKMGCWPRHATGPATIASTNTSALATIAVRPSSGRRPRSSRRRAAVAESAEGSLPLSNSTLAKRRRRPSSAEAPSERARSMTTIRETPALSSTSKALAPGPAAGLSSTGAPSEPAKPLAMTASRQSVPGTTTAESTRPPASATKRFVTASDVS